MTRGRVDEVRIGVTSGSRAAQHVRALRRVPFFAALDQTDLDALSARTACRSYRRRELIAGSQETDYCWVIVRGAARAYHVSPKGREVTIEGLPTGSVFGLVLLDETIGVTGLVEAATDNTVACRFPARYIEQLCRTNPEFALSVIRLLARRLETAHERLADFALHDARTRLAHTLSMLAIRSDDLVVKETHRELAALIGARAEDVTKLLRQLREEGLVTWTSGLQAIQVLDVDRLTSYGS